MKPKGGLSWAALGSSRVRFVAVLCQAAVAMFEFIA